MWKRLVLAACAVLLAAGCPVALSVAPAAAQTGSFTFGAAGDFGANSRTDAVLKAVAGAGTDLFLAVGDLSYSQVTPESAWCDFVKARVGSTYPFEIVAGNHETGGADGLIDNFAACLPDRVGGVSGSYGKEYYFDYPPSAPLARFIAISPNLAFPGQATYAYKVGTAHYNWLSGAIDSARAAGIPWVIVGMHENCLKAGSTACEIGTDLQNLLVGKKVDLVLQGHSHSYQRSKQLALGPACSAVTNSAFNANCVVNDGSSGTYTKGAGPVQVISGTGGEGFASVTTSDPDAQYFAKFMGSGSNPSAGFTRFQVTATQLTARFVAATGTFSDSFTIAAATPPGNQAPTAAAAAVTTPQGTAVPVTLRASDPDNCELAFSVVTPPAHGTLSALSDQPCVPGSPNQDSATATYTPDPAFSGTDAFTFKANDGTVDSNTATVTVSVAAPPANQPPTALAATLTTPQGTAGPVTLRASDPDNCELAFSVVTPPAHGTLSALSDQPCLTGSPNQDSATVTYTPDPAFTGADSFSFKANDGTADSNTATVSVTVTGTTPAAIAFRAASSAQNPTATTLTIGRPAGVVAGDVMVAGVGIRGAPGVTPPAGWTFIRTDPAGTYTTQVLYYRVATASEPASYTWSFSASVPAAGGILDYSGVNTAAPVNASSGAGQNVTTTSIPAPSVTTTVAGACVVGFFSIGGDNSITPPAGMTGRGQANSSAGTNHVTWEGSDFTPASPGATGTETATGTNPHPNVGALVALTPA